MAGTCGVRRGLTVYGSDGARLGNVFQCDEHRFVVERGVVFAQDYLVEYEDVATVDGTEVHLRVPSEAFLPEEEAERWDPPRDLEGSAGGTDIEPLRAGMAEIEEQQGVGGAGEDPLARRERVRREAVARQERRARPAAPASAPGEAAGRPTLTIDGAELERRIGEEMEDYELGGGCAPRGPELAPGPAPEGGAARGRRRRVRRPARRAGPAALAPCEPGATAELAEQPPRMARRAGAGGRRLDFRRVAPEAVAPLRELEEYVRGCGLEAPLLELVRLRASQVNGCAYCIDMHQKDARRAGETEQRLYLLAVWREAPFFTDRERAALAWTEAVTRIGSDRVDDETYRLAREQLSERELVNLTMAVVAINGWNRLAIAFRSEPGSYQPADT